MFLVQNNTCQVCGPIERPSFWVISSAAFVDSINPCAIAVLLILLGALLATKEKKKAAATGLFFIFALYLAYFLLGLGLVSFLQLSGLATLFHRLIGGLAILVGLLNLKDFFWYGGGGFVMEIPRSWRPTIQKLLKGVTSPFGAFLMGFVVTAFELPCTGGPYVFVLGLLSSNINWTKILPTLLYYNFIFVLPLLFITSLIYFGYSTVEKTTAWKDRNLRILHLIAGLIMLSLGIWVFLS
ncbi:MAG: cytochrome c biogenesis CcdA family protein [Patescibacteria group bacterium]